MTKITKLSRAKQPIKQSKEVKSSKKKPKEEKFALSILGAEYDIELVEQFVELKGLYGATDADARKIYIHATEDKTMLSHVIFHESLHAALHESGLSQLLTPKSEEAIVRMLEHFLRDKVDVEKMFLP